MAKIKEREKASAFEVENGVRYHWIILKDDGSAIWGGVYPSKDSAMAELSFQNLSGYHVERRASQFQKTNDE